MLKFTLYIKQDPAHAVEPKALLFGLISAFLCGIGFSIIMPIVPFLVKPYINDPRDSIFGPSFNGMLSKSVDSSEQGRIQGGSQSIQALARVVGPIVGGQLYTSLGHAAPAMMGIILILSAILVLSKSTGTWKKSSST